MKGEGSLLLTLSSTKSFGISSFGHQKFRSDSLISWFWTWSFWSLLNSLILYDFASVFFSSVLTSLRRIWRTNGQNSLSDFKIDTTISVVRSPRAVQPSLKWRRASAEKVRTTTAFSRVEEHHRDLYFDSSSPFKTTTSFLRVWC